jgi:hypothetical protein
MTFRLSPIVLTQNYGTRTVNVTIALTGAGGSAGGGNLAAGEASVVFQLGPHFLPTRQRNIVDVVGNTTVTLVGAAAFAQGEELEGANATIILDGARARASAGTIEAVESRDDIVAVEAEEAVSSGYEICEFSGIKMLPGEGVMDWRGNLVHPAYKDPEPKREYQNFRSVTQDKSGGALLEGDDVFISTSVSPGDL